MSSETSVDGAHRPERIDEEGHEESTLPDDTPFLPADSDDRPVLSVVLPTLNEEEGVAECLRRIQTAIDEIDVTAEVIVSDSSTDRTPEIAREMGAIVVEPDEMGYGNAYQYGFDHARGDYVVMGDADTTYDFTELPKLYRHVAEGDADVAMGSRLDGEIKPGAMPPLHQYVGNPVLTAFLNIFYQAGISDAHSGFRVISRSALEQLDLESDGMEFASEMVMDASVKDLTIEEEPITYHERKGEATLNSFTDGWRHVRFMLVNAPGYLFSGPGIVLSVLGIVAMALTLSGVVLAGVDFSTRTMIAGSLLTIMGVNATSLGVFTVVAGDPIRRPSDRITTWIAEVATLERGILLGVASFVGGSAYAIVVIWQWATAGYNVDVLPSVTADIAAFTAIVIGVQLVLGSFFISLIADQGNRSRTGGAKR